MFNCGLIIRDLGNKLFLAWIPAPIKTFLINYCCSISLLLTGYFFYTSHPHFKTTLINSYNLYWFSPSGKDVLTGFVLICTALLLPFYLLLPKHKIPKSRLVWRAILNFFHRWPTVEEKTALLATIVRLFFIPLVLIWLVEHSSSIIFNFNAFLTNGNFFPNGYWFLFYAILWIDVLFFTLAYAIEHPYLGNEIRSVDSTVLGWFVMLICYPPFNGMTNQIFGWYSSNEPAFTALWAQWLGGLSLLFFMGIYAWASVALGLRAGNLTNRGIVCKGPYAYVRHPAYIAKNIAWWIGSIPILINLWALSITQFVFAIFCIAAWSFIYYLRARTEERHLMPDLAYQRYCEKVRYKFIPGLY